MSGAKPDPLASRVLAVFASPGTLFESFRQRAPWVGPLVISTIVVMLAMATMPQEVFLAQAESAVDRRGDPVTITSEPADIATYGRLMAVLGVAVANPTAAFAVAGILTLVFSLLGGGPATYRQFLAATTHSLLIVSLGTLIGIVMQLAGLPGSSIALLLLEPLLGPGSTVAAILQNLNFFLLWMILVLGLAVSKLDDRRSWPVAASVIFGLYLVFALATSSVTG
ncbi:MAG TPA: YIP1 family protein [Longimicrobiaceae bacterium]|nr:YIP1 family protein [Longimicrobiaceae bacterium]